MFSFSKYEKEEEEEEEEEEDEEEWLWIIYHFQTASQFQIKCPRSEDTAGERPRPNAPPPLESKTRNPTATIIRRIYGCFAFLCLAT